LANTKSAIKNVRKNQRRREINKTRKGTLRTQIKKLRALVKSKDVEGSAKELVKTEIPAAEDKTSAVEHARIVAAYTGEPMAEVASSGSPLSWRSRMAARPKP
jgi:ribosomal protein S20